MPKIRMKETHPGHDVCDRGITQPARQFEAGEEYEVGDELARCFCDDLKVAERVRAVKAPAPENKDQGKAPQNKSTRE